MDNEATIYFERAMIYQARICELETLLSEARDQRDENAKLAQDVDAQAREDQTKHDEHALELKRERETARENEANALHDLAIATQAREAANLRRDVWKERAKRYWRIVETTREARNVAQDDALHARTMRDAMERDLRRAQRDIEARDDKRIATWRVNAGAEDALTDWIEADRR